MSFELFLSALKPFSEKGFNKLETYGEKEAYIISSLSPKYELMIMKDIIKQPDIQNCEYSIMQFDINTHKLNIITNFIEENIISPINFQITDDSIIVNCVSVHSLGSYLINSNNRYTFLSIDYQSEIYDLGHRAILVVDNKYYKVYLLDPNGKASYFNRIINNVDNLIESYIDQYFNMINTIFQTDYKYIKTNIWNSKNICINDTSNIKLSSGDCMTISLMLCQIIKNLEITPETLYTKLKDMSDDEIVSLIRSYSLGLIEYITPFGKLNNINRLYNIYEILKGANTDFNSFIEFNQYLHKKKEKLPDLYLELLSAYNISVY